MGIAASRSRRAWAFALAWAWAASAAGSDGVFEINHACASGPGCFAGDAGGYPVTIAQRGSYRLTSDLSSAANAPVISIQFENVTLDLNGFTVSGGGPAQSGAAIASGHRASVRNGFVRASLWDGVQLGGSSRVEDLHVHGNANDGVAIAGEGTVRGVVATSNTGDGIQAGAASAIDGCTATGNGGSGIRLPSGTVRGSTATQNTGQGGSFGRDVSFAANLFAQNAAGDLAGGHASGGNICADGSCSSDGRRRYYLTPATYDGANADAACASGFHMATIYELSEPGGLHYDRTRGFVYGASTPPTGVFGWSGSGQPPYSSDLPGLGDCDGFGTVAPGKSGTVLRLPINWDPANQQGAPWKWSAEPRACATPQRVWCVED